MSPSDVMLVAKPAPEEKIRELASVIARARPEISVDGFLLPRDVSSNFQWNTLSTSNQSLMLDWYVSVVAPLRGLAAKDPDTKRVLLEDLLGDILTNPDYAVVVNNERVPLTVNYLLERDNWFSHAAGVAINRAISARLGSHYSDIHVVLSPKNPWLEVVHFVLGKEGQSAGIIEKIARLKGGPREVYRDVIFDSAFFSRTRIFEALGDIPLGFGRRRTSYRVHWTNYYYAVPEGVGWYHAILSYIPLLFAQHPLLRRIPGFNLRPADVRFEFPDGDYSGTWEITIDYDVTPIDRVRSWFNVGELQETVATLSAEVLELQRDRKALTEEAEQLAGQLIEAEKLAAVGRLSFGVGHDLRNTLATAINSGIPLRRLMADLHQIMRMLEENEPREEVSAYLSRRRVPTRLANAPGLYETMMGSLAQALDNVKALEGYAVQDGSDFQEVRIEEVIQRVLQDHQDKLQGIQVETFFEEREYVFKGNPLKLYAVFQNLVVNAMEVLEDEARPVLRITTQVSDGVHRTMVEDNGRGMEEEVRSHAFEPFYTTKGLADGRQRGLGLFNVWRLVEQHGGTIEIESEPGEYTRVCVSFNITTVSD